MTPSSSTDPPRRPTLPFERVLVPLDGSPRSADAVPVGVAIARRFRVSLAHLTVCANEAQRETATAASARFVPSDRLEVRVDDVAGAILADADALCCLSTHGRGRVGDHLWGSVAQEVVSRSTRSVVVVGPRFDPLAFDSVERIVVCTDGSATVERTLPTVRRWATTLDVEVEVLTVRPDADERVVDLVRPIDDDGYFDRFDAEQAEHVRHLAERLTSQGLRAGWRVLRGDDIATVIAEHAREQPGTLLALHTHGRGGVDRPRFGTVTMEVVRDSRAPVLLTGPAVAAEEVDL